MITQANPASSATTRKVRVTRGFMWEGKPTEIDQELDLPTLFAHEMVSSGKAQFVGADPYEGPNPAYLPGNGPQPAPTPSIAPAPENPRNRNAAARAPAGQTGQAAQGNTAAAAPAGQIPKSANNRGDFQQPAATSGQASGPSTDSKAGDSPNKQVADAKQDAQSEKPGSQNK